MGDRNLPRFTRTSVGFLLNKLAQRIVQTAALGLSGMGIHARHVGVMATLAEFGRSSQKTIGESLLIDRTTMVDSVDDLEGLGFVTRSPDPNDRRAVLVALTPLGRRTLKRAEEVVAGIEADFLEPLPPLQREQFIAILGTLFRGEDDHDSP
jgi:DNA-binding MarR family transcriptional regulator